MQTFNPVLLHPVLTHADDLQRAQVERAAARIATARRRHELFRLGQLRSRS